MHGLCPRAGILHTILVVIRRELLVLPWNSGNFTNVAQVLPQNSCYYLYILVDSPGVQRTCTDPVPLDLVRREYGTAGSDSLATPYHCGSKYGDGQVSEEAQCIKLYQDGQIPAIGDKQQFQGTTPYPPYPPYPWMSFK